MTAPEPVEVAMSAARFRGWLSEHHDGPSGFLDDARAIMAEYDRMRAELVILREKRRSREHSIAELTFLRCENERAEAHLARALPIVAAAEALESWWEKRADKGSSDADAADLLDALARAVRAAREPRTGEGM